MQIAIVLFDRITALDAVGPYEVFNQIPEFEVTFVGHHPGTVRTENGQLGLAVDATFEDVTEPDVVVMPGGRGTRTLLHDEQVLQWLVAAHRTSLLTSSVCTGSLVLAAAGLLDGLTAATHWSAYDQLAELGAVPTAERVVEHWDRRIVTAAGVSSGIDMGLTVTAHLVDVLAAQAAQLRIEYDPQPPFDAGSVAKAGPQVMARAEQYAAVRL